MLHLQVGKTYVHSDPQFSTKFKITKQWNATIFEGHTTDLGKDEDPVHYLFTKSGTVLGFVGWTGNATFAWKLNAIPQYEVMVVFASGSITEWQPLTLKSMVSFDARYLVRERGNHSTLQLLNHDQAKDLYLEM